MTKKKLYSAKAYFNVEFEIDHYVWLFFKHGKDKVTKEFSCAFDSTIFLAENAEQVRQSLSAEVNKSNENYMSYLYNALSIYDIKLLSNYHSVGFRIVATEEKDISIKNLMIRMAAESFLEYFRQEVYPPIDILIS
jgi:hypothetical protein